MNHSILVRLYTSLRGTLHTNVTSPSPETEFLGYIPDAFCNILLSHNCLRKATTHKRGVRHPMVCITKTKFNVKWQSRSFKVVYFEISERRMRDYTY